MTLFPGYTGDRNGFALLPGVQDQRGCVNFVRQRQKRHDHRGLAKRFRTDDQFANLLAFRDPVLLFHLDKTLFDLLSQCGFFHAYHLFRNPRLGPADTVVLDF